MHSKMIAFLATGFGSGRLPGAKGTYGTLVAIPISLLFSRLAPIPFLVTLVTLIVLAVWVAHQMVAITGEKDPQSVVIDEIVGYLVSMALLPHSLGFMALAFALFRVCDTVKFWPIKWLEKNLKGGMGIVMDDVAAGLFVQIMIRGLISWVGGV